MATLKGPATCKPATATITPVGGRSVACVRSVKTPSIVSARSSAAALPGAMSPGPRAGVSGAPLPARATRRVSASASSQGLPESAEPVRREQRPSRLQASPSSSSPPLPPDPQYSSSFLLRRWTTFFGLVLGYACFYLTRNSLTYTAPAMVADPSVAVGMTEIGTMTSIFPIAYGTSKFVSGVLGSRTSPRVLLAGGLAATALLNLAFGSSASLVWFCTWWALNGTLQGVGAPCCARILTAWYAASERGTYWGMWNIAHNMGGFLAPILAGTACKLWGWRWGMYAPGIVGLGMALLILLGVRDSPEAVGFPAVEAQRAGGAAPAVARPAAEGPEASLLSLLVNDCLKNPFVVGLALTYFFVYVVRQGVTSWFVFYLLQVKGVSDAGAASLRVSGLELGGLFGSLLAGKLSDVLIASARPGAGNVGRRIRVVIAYTVGVAAMLLAFAAAPASASWLQWATVFMIGFFLYGPQMLIGLCGAELVRPESVGASQGFLGWVAYLGAANAGIPLSMIVKNYGWTTYFAALLAACGAAVLLLAPMINAKSYVQIQEQRAKAL